MRWTSVWLLLCSLLPALVQADAALNWLQRMVNATAQLNYQGQLVYASAAEVASFRLLHVRVKGEEWEHIVRLDGHNAELLRGGGDLILREGASGATRMSALPGVPAGTELRRHLAELPSHYRLSVAPGARIAGREAVLLSLQPRTADRYGVELFLDKDSSLLLRARVLAADGQALETVSFTELTVGREVGLAEYRAARRQQPRPVSAPHPRPEPVAGLGFAPWLPPGFSLMVPGLRQKRINGNPVLMASYSDGISNFSLFSELAPAATAPASRQRGATVMASRAVVRAGQTYRLTLVGELPPAVAERILASLP